jgi:DNA-binding transcriptional LysR family regulator
MDIQDLMIFSRVAALQNLSAVGTELGLTPGTISKRIQALEEALAVRLFERTTRSIRITAEGKSFLSHVDRILAELEMARASMATSTGKPVGKLKISVPLLVGRLYVAPLLVDFLNAYPDIDVQLDMTDRCVNLHEEGYDFAIRSGALHDSTLIAKRLATDRIVIAASPAYLTARGVPSAPEQLANHQCLALGDSWSWLFSTGGTETPARIVARLRSDSSEALRIASLAGLGLIRTSELQIADELASGRLVSVLNSYIDNASTGIYALYVSGRHILPRQRVFLDFVGDWFRTQRRTGGTPQITEMSNIADDPGFSVVNGRR